MKTTRIISLFAAAMSLIFAATASAVPASKRMGSEKFVTGSCVSTGAHAEHQAMTYVGPRGKGYICHR